MWIARYGRSVPCDVHEAPVASTAMRIESGGRANFSHRCVFEPERYTLAGRSLCIVLAGPSGDLVVVSTIWLRPCPRARMPVSEISDLLNKQLGKTDVAAERRREECHNPVDHLEIYRGALSVTRRQLAALIVGFQICL